MSSFALLLATSRTLPPGSSSVNCVMTPSSFTNARVHLQLGSGGRYVNLCVSVFAVKLSGGFALRDAVVESFSARIRC